MIKWNALILINPPSPIKHCAQFYCTVPDSYVDYAPMSGKLIFFKGMLIHISENNDKFIFGYTVVPNKTHLEYKLLPNSELQFQICKYGTNDYTCANSVLTSKHFNSKHFNLKSPNDLLYALAIPHYS